MAISLTELRSMARSHTESAINTLAGIMNEPSAPHSARVNAANSLLDRGWGKAAQIINGDAEGGAVKITVLTGVPRAD